MNTPLPTHLRKAVAEAAKEYASRHAEDTDSALYSELGMAFDLGAQFLWSKIAKMSDDTKRLDWLLTHKVVVDGDGYLFFRPGKKPRQWIDAAMEDENG